LKEVRPQAGFFVGEAFERSLPDAFGGGVKEKP
jgi:hypothetical protein